MSLYRIKPQPKIPARKAMMWIAFFTVLVSGGAALTLLYIFHIKALQGTDPAFQIAVINHPELLDTVYLTELLDLSVDTPAYLPLFNVESGKQKLLKSPVIKEAHLKKIQPSTLQINYTLRKPIAVLADWKNGAIDEEGVLIPLKPFFDGEGLPKVVLGDVGNPAWGERLNLPRVELLFSVLKSMEKKGINLQVDVSRAEALSFGRREIIIAINSPQIFLRLNPDHWRQGIAHYQKMGEILKGRDKVVIDLRLKHLAYIE